jgi:hypothetical protein
VHLELETLIQHGVPPVLVAIIFMFKMYLDKRRQTKDTDGVPLVKRLTRIETDTRWLKEAHDVKDSDGVFSWYVRASLKQEVSRLADAISGLQLTMHDIHKGQEFQTKIQEQQTKIQEQQTIALGRRRCRKGCRLHA